MAADFTSRLARWALVVCLGVVCVPIAPAADEWVYTVVPGDNLWNFSKQHLDTVLHFEELRRLNNIERPAHMRPGTIIRVPMSWIPASVPVPVVIIAKAGSATVTRASGEKIAAEEGMEVFLGDSVRSDRESSIAFRFADDSVLTLHEDSEIRMDHLSAHGETGMADSRMKLREGRIEVRVTPSTGAGSRFEIHTPSAISAVRGTEYRASVGEASASNIEVIEGAVDVNAQQQEQSVPAAFGTQVELGKAPLPPVALLPAPVLETVLDRIRTLNWSLSWEPVEGASGYRVEVASDPRFNTLIWQSLTPGPNVVLPSLADGPVALRVRAVDSLGLEGLSSVVSTEIDARPLAPLALQPQDMAIYRGSAPTLRWSASTEASRYRLEISSDPDFATLIFADESLSENYFDTTESSMIGSYHWRLTSITADGELGPAGVSRSYQIKPLPHKVEATLDSASDGLLRATWPVGTPQQSYQVQISYDRQFGKVEFDQVLQKPGIEFAATKGRERFLRVRAIEPDGFQGPWGAPQTIEALPSENHWLVPLLFVVAFLIL